MTPVLNRITALERTFAAAFAALEDLPQSDADRIAAAVVAHVRSSRPQALLVDAAVLPSPVDPVQAVERLLDDGARYHVSAQDGHTVLTVADAHGDLATVALAAIQVQRLRHDLAEVAAKAGVSIPAR